MRKVTTFRRWYAESNQFPGMVHQKRSLSTYGTQKGIAKHSKKSAKIPLFCHSFVARSLADHFQRTIHEKVLTLWGMVCSLSVFQAPESKHNAGYDMQKVTTFQCMVRGKWAISMVWYAKSELKSAKISGKLRQKCKIFYEVKLGGLGTVDSWKTDF